MKIHLIMSFIMYIICNVFSVTLQSVPGVSMLDLIRYQSGSSSVGIIVFLCLQEIKRAIRRDAVQKQRKKNILVQRFKL